MRIRLTSVFDANLTLTWINVGFGYMTLKQISMSADVGIGQQIKIDVKR